MFLKKELIRLSFITISPHIGALLCSSTVTFITGFLLARYIVFSDSFLRKREQFPRYLLSTLGSLLLNYINLKIMVDLLNFYPTLAQLLNVVIVVTFSYSMQKYFAFKGSGSQ